LTFKESKLIDAAINNDAKTKEELIDHLEKAHKTLLETRPTAEDTMTLSEEQVKNYQKNGIIKIKLPADVIALKDEFLRDCCKFLKHWINFDSTPERLPYDLVELAKKDRAIIGKLYKVSKRFRASRQLSSHPFFINIAKQLMNTTLVSCFHLTIVRMDIPNEEKIPNAASSRFSLYPR